MKKSCLKWCGIAVIAILVTGCSSKVVSINKDLIIKTKRVGVISVIMERAGGDTPNNIEIRGKVIEHAMETYQKGMAEAMGWDMVPVSTYIKDPTLKDMVNIPKNPETFDFLFDLANKNQMPLDNEAVMAQAIIAAMSGDNSKMEGAKKDAVWESAKEIQKKIVEDAQKRHQGYKGLPTITRSMSVAKGGPKTHIEAYRAIFRKNVVTFCKANRLDAVLIVQMYAEISKFGDVNVIVDEGRTKGIIKLNPTFVIVASNGETLIAMDSPRMDDLAPMDMGPPIYIGKPGTSEFRPDFKDRKGRVLAAWNALVDKTAHKLIAKLQEAAK